MTFSINNYYYIADGGIIVEPITQTRKIKFKRKNNVLSFDLNGRHYHVKEDLFQNRIPYKVCVVRIIGKMLTNSVDYWDSDWGSNLFLLSIIDTESIHDGLIINKAINLDENYYDQYLVNINNDCWLEENTHVSDKNLIQKKKLHNLEWVRN